MQAVTRVKLEQASKVMMWMPTRLKIGEGRADREETNNVCGETAEILSLTTQHGVTVKFSFENITGSIIIHSVEQHP